jgi:hypothetical protein
MSDTKNLPTATLADLRQATEGDLRSAAADAHDAAHDADAAGAEWGKQVERLLGLLVWGRETGRLRPGRIKATGS